MRAEGQADREGEEQQTLPKGEKMRFREVKCYL